MEGGINLFVYAQNDPINWIDPSGRLGVGIVGEVSAGVGLGPGAIGSASGGGGVFWGNGLNLGAFGTLGALLGIGPYGPRYPDTPGSRGWLNGVIGYGASGGLGLFGTNAKSACDLEGPFKTISISGGVLWNMGT